MFCIKCGAELPDEALFCSACGKKIHSHSDSNQKDQENKFHDEILKNAKIKEKYSKNDKIKEWKPVRIAFFFVVPWLLSAIALGVTRPDTVIFDSIVTGLIWMGILTPFFGFKRKLKKSVLFRNKLKILNSDYKENILDEKNYKLKKLESIWNFVNSEYEESNKEAIESIFPLLKNGVLLEEEVDNLRLLMEAGTYLLENGSVMVLHGSYNSLKEIKNVRVTINSQEVPDGNYAVVGGKYNFIVNNSNIIEAKLNYS